MHKRTMALSRSARLALLGAAMTFMPGIVHALGLGKLTVYSALNERLSAEIPLTSVSKRELKTLAVGLGTQANFSTARPELSPLFGNIEVRLVEHADGQHSLQLRSKHPIREPYLRLLLQVEWAGGRLIREFTALIDPRDPVTDEPTVVKPLVPGPYGRSISEASRESAAAPRQVSHAAGNSNAKLKIERPDSVVEQNAVEQGAQPGQQRKADSVRGSKVLSSKQSVASATPASRTAVTQSDAGSPRTTSSVKEKELAERIRVLESQIKTLNDVVELKNKTLAEAQQIGEQGRSRETDIESPEVMPSSRAATRTGTKRAQQPVVAGPAKSKAKVQGVDGASQRGSPASEEKDRFSKRQLSMVVVLLVAGLILFVGIAMVFVYMRRKQPRSTPAEDKEGLGWKTKSATGDISVIDDRRSGRGRRRQFVSVPFERRRGPRRRRDRIRGLVATMQAEKADTVEETDTYMACGRDEHAEGALKDAIARNPDRHALKVKLLAIYQQRQDTAAFESLANQLYATLEMGTPLEEETDELTDDMEVGGETREVLEKGLGEPGGNPVTEHELNVRDTDRLDEENMDESGSWSLNERAEKQTTESEIELLAIDLPNDEKQLFERDIDALRMDVPKAEDESTRRIMGGLRVDDKEQAGESAEDKDTATRGLEVLDVDDLVDIKQSVEHGMAVMELAGPTDDNESAHKKVAKKKPTKKTTGRSGKGKRKGKASQEADSQTKDPKQEQWRNPATRIDLAKAYIEMGDAERARHLLDEVLESWHRDDGAGD